MMLEKTPLSPPPLPQVLLTATPTSAPRDATDPDIHVDIIAQNGIDILTAIGSNFIPLIFLEPTSLFSHVISNLSDSKSTLKVKIYPFLKV